jgi:hypothetical protein
MKRLLSAAAILTILFSFASNAPAADDEKPVFDAIAASQADDDKYEWTYLFDGKSLDGWIDIKDAGDFVVKVKDDVLVLGMGPTTTSIRFDEEGTGIKIPRENYEIEYVSRRTSGTDFFSALTFPIKDKYVTFVNGGWGGFVVGISSIDDMDASENSTSSFMNFKTGQWYRFRVQVTNRTLRVWINDEKTIDYVVEGHSLKTRFEVSRCEPLGFASWVSEGELKTIRFRTLGDEEIEEIDKRAEENSKFNFN